MGATRRIVPACALVASLAVCLGLAPAASATVVQGPGSPFSVGVTPTSVAVGDLDRNGAPDLVVANNGVTVLLGDGHGGFSPASGSPFTAGNSAFSIAVADLNRDGRLDVVTGNIASTD